ncbi:MAG TPA: hypothetical protein VH518_14470, partial [Tepidisphaeraceae bacterium]
NPGESFDLPSYRLLSDLGHDVTAIGSTDGMMEILQRDKADLLVVDADRPERQEVVNRIGELPADQQPRQIAIFSDSVEDETLATLVHRITGAKVHVLLKPLHIHRLLGVLRHIEAKA